MKNVKNLTLFAALLFTLGSLAADAQITPSRDAYTNTAFPTMNFGAKTLLDVESASQTTYIQFDLSAIPAGYTSANITKATLKLYVNAVTTAGSFNVDLVNGTWAESKITANNAPALGTTIAASVPLTTADKNQYILIDITAAVGEWLNGTQPNDGVALVGNSPLNATFDSKENTTTSHPAELDIVFAGGGTITGVTTASGSGLIGGGTSGTLNLALTNSCTANQVLQWNGSSWACASVGTGTITGVTAGPGLLGGGLTGNVTLSLDTTKVPLLGASNMFSATQTVTSGDVSLSNGNLDLPQTTGPTVGVINVGGSPFIHLCCSVRNTFLGIAAGNFTMSGTGNVATGYEAMVNNTTGYSNAAYGINALSSNTTGFLNTATGYSTLGRNTTGSYNTATGILALGFNTTGTDNTADGVDTLVLNSTGSYNTAIGEFALNENTVGSYNTATGVQALEYSTTGNNNTALGLSAGNASNHNQTTGSNNTFVGANTSPGTQTNLNNTTAIGANAEVDISNAMVLGSINGLNGATADTLVGIGTTAPTYKLHVGTINQNGFRVEGPATPGSGFVAASFGGYGDFGIDAFGRAQQRFVVKESGFVGIGTATPDSLLTVNGSADKPGGGSWGTYSDRRLKTLDGSFHSGLSQILKLNPVRYRYKQENALSIHDSQEHVGLVAQEVQRVIPEAVTENSKGYLLVNNDPIIWSMLNAIKEQQTIITRQQQQIKTQQAEIARLASQVTSIQASLKARGAPGSEVQRVNAKTPTMRQ